MTPHRTRLEGTWQELAVTRGAALLAAGRAADTVIEFESAVSDHPYHEAIWAVYVTALYQAGRPADALAAVQRVRALLDEDLGLVPGPELQQLEHQILVHDPALAPRLPPGSATARVAGNLPSLAIELVGRGHEVAALCELVARHRLVEVVGTGGVGKTAIAIAVARLAADRRDAWLIRLEGAASASEVVDATVAPFGVVGGEAALVERLRAGPALVVLDNCEHVLDEAAWWIVRLLDAAPELHVLCTSQAPLDIDGEVLFELGPLEVDDAVELFSRRAAAQRTRSTDDGERAVVLELCRSLDGLPLAIELAAARTRTLSVAEITRRLDDRFYVLSDPSSRRPERRRALRATIGWSYDLLFPDDQRGLWALATFAGGASLPAVEHVLAALDVPGPAAIDVVDRLASRSLVIVDDGDTGPRYRLLDSIRAYALEAMAAAGCSAAAESAHAAWYGRAAAVSTAGVRSRDQSEHLAFARAERANIDVALSWYAAHDPLAGLSLAIGIGWAWVVLGHARGADRLLAALDAAGERATDRERADALLLLGWLEASTELLEPARVYLAEATAIAERVGDDGLRARCAYHQAYVVSHLGEFGEAIDLTDRSRDLFGELDLPWDRAANALFGLRAAISAGDEARAVAVADESGRLLDRVDDPWLHVRYEVMLGELARLQHRFDDAVDRLTRALATSTRAGYLPHAAYQAATLGRVQWQLGDERAVDTLRDAIERAEGIGDVRMVALARVHLGRVLRGLGRLDEATHVLERATAWHRQAGGGEQALLGECLLAAIELVEGADGATAAIESILQVARDRPDPPVEVFTLDALARDAARRGDLVGARRLLGEADARMSAASHFIAERDRVDAHAAAALIT